MKKILSLLLAGVMIFSIIPTAFATTNSSNGTNVIYDAEDPDGDGNKENVESYTITVPAVLTPGSQGNVIASGMWPSNKQLKMTADATVTLTNSISGGDEKVLDILFPGISLFGSNTTTVTDTKIVSVDNMPSNALFGIWSGTFNYNVEIGVVHEGIIPEGGTYYVGVADGYSGSLSTATAVYQAGEKFPEVNDNDAYVFGNYEYRYNQHVSDGPYGTYWDIDTSINGWGVAARHSDAQYENPLSSINGKPITSMRATFEYFYEQIVRAPKIPDTVTNLQWAFAGCSALTKAPVIPDSVTNMESAFRRCTSLTEPPVLPDGVTNIAYAFEESGITTAPVIPSSVTYMLSTFNRCTALQGTIIINTNNITNTNYADYSCRQCFDGVDMSNITLTGEASTDVLNLIGSTGKNWTPLA